MMLRYIIQDIHLMFSGNIDFWYTSTDYHLLSIFTIQDVTIMLPTTIFFSQGIRKKNFISYSIQVFHVQGFNSKVCFFL